MIKAPAGKLEGVCHQCHQPGHYRMQCPEWQKKKEPEAAAGAMTRSLRSRDLSCRRQGDDESPSLFVWPVRSNRGRRSVKMYAYVPSGADDSTSESLSTSRYGTHPSWTDVGPSSSQVNDEPSETIESNITGPANSSEVSREWLEYLRKYPPPPWVPSVQPEHRVPLAQPEHRVPLVQPEHRVPLAQPEHRVPLAQPEHWVPATQPRVPSVQPVDKTFKRQVDKESKKNTNNRLDASGSKSEAGTNVCTAGNTYYIEIKLGKKRCSGLLDTGSEVTLLPKQLADLSQINRSSRKLKAANGTQINIVGEWRTMVTMGPLRVAMNFIVSDQIDEILIGVDWLREHKCLLSFADLTITLQGYCIPMLKKVYFDACNRVISEEEVILPAKSEAVISGKVVYANLRRPPPSLCVTDNKECRPGVETIRCLLNCGEGSNLPLRILNINNESVTLPAGTFLCPLREVEAVLMRKSPKEQSILVHVDELKKCVPVNETNQVRLTQYLRFPLLQEMPKRKAVDDAEETKKKEVMCPECKKRFRGRRMQTDTSA